MAIEVEIYDEREIDSGTLEKEADAEALALIEELGLNAQKHESGARIAYPQPTADQGFIIGVLFPQATELSRYDAGCIPLRVLKEIRSYRAENSDHVLFIRHSAPAQVKDPILMACTKSQYASWMMSHNDQWENMRMIARWGDALEPWSELMGMARAVMAERAASALDVLIRKATAMRDSVKATGSWPSVLVPKLDNVPEGW